MASVSGIATISGSDLYTSTATPGDGIFPGQIVWDDKTGKAFRYTLSGVAQTIGDLQQESVNDTTYTNMAVASAAAVGSYTLAITNGTATLTNAGEVGASLSVYTAGTVAIGDEYTVTAVSGTLTTGGALTVTLDRPLRYAFTTSAKVTIKRSPWSGSIQFPASTQTGIPVGVSIYPIADTQYGWTQTHGVCAVLSDGSTFAVGSDLSTPSGTAGAVTVGTAGTTHCAVGYARQVSAASHAISAFLKID